MWDVCLKQLPKFSRVRIMVVSRKR
ncbi:hypothetical protein [Altibacter sp.]